MSLLDRLAVADVAPLPDAPVLVLCNGGIDPAAIELLRGGAGHLQMVADQEDFLLELARAHDVISRFDPLVGHRHAGTETGPGHPWYGAERTAAQAMGQALRQGLQLQLAGGAGRLILVVRRLFWEVQDCRPLLDLLMGPDASARLLMLTGPVDRSAETLAEEEGWRLDAAENAVVAMNGVFAELAKSHGGKSLLWTLPEALPDRLPTDVAEFLA